MPVQRMQEPFWKGKESLRPALTKVVRGEFPEGDPGAKLELHGFLYSSKKYLWHEINGLAGAIGCSAVTKYFASYTGLSK